MTRRMYYFLAAFILFISSGNDLTAQEAGDFVEAAEEGDWEEAAPAEGAALASPLMDTGSISREEYIPPAPGKAPQESLSQTDQAEEGLAFSDSDTSHEILEVHTKSRQDMAIGASLPQAILPSQKGRDPKKQEEKNKKKVEIKENIRKTRAHEALQTASPGASKNASHLLLPYKK